MHELSLANEIVRMVEAAAARDHFKRVHTLTLEVGALAGVEVSALRFALATIVRGTCLQGAVIDIEEPLGLALCSQCGDEVNIGSRAELCPRCNGYPLRVISGGALRVVDVVVIADDADAGVTSGGQTCV
jgi:hydrogenase nickel incorporation protein HypA/HybF